MYKIEVGKLFQEGVTRYQEGSHFDFTQSGPILLLFFRNPTEREIQDVRDGRAEFAFYEKHPVIFFLAKFGSGPWMDAPYTVHLSKPFEFEQMEEWQGFGLHVVLVDAATGIVKAMRLIGLSNKFSIMLKEAIERQKEIPFDAAQYDSAIAVAYSNLTTKDMVMRADARTKA